MMSDCRYCSKSGNCLRHEGYNSHLRFLSPCIGERCESYKVRKKRQPYIRGAKEYLSSFSIGEKRYYDGYFRWNSLKSIACLLKGDFGCEFRFMSGAGMAGKRVIVRVA